MQGWPPVAGLAACIDAVPARVRGSVLARHRALAEADLTNPVVADRLHSEAALVLMEAMEDRKVNDETAAVLGEAVSWHNHQARQARRQPWPLPTEPAPPARWRYRAGITVHLAITGCAALATGAVAAWLISQGQWRAVGVITTAAIGLGLIVSWTGLASPKPAETRRATQRGRG